MPTAPGSHGLGVVAEGVVGDPSARALREQRGHPVHGEVDHVRVEATLEAARGVGAQAEFLGGLEDVASHEVGGFDQGVRRLLPHLGVLGAHNPGDHEPPLLVGDHEHLLVELAGGAVEERDLAHPACARLTTMPSRTFAASKAWMGWPVSSMT